MTDQRTNAGQAAGQHRVRLAALFDAEIHAHNERFRAAADIGSRDHVLDIGCGTGQSTREAARAAVSGSALGVDLSEPALEHARRLSEEEGLRNVTYLRADAQVHRFAERRFDVCVSRFGAMFFADPVVAFTNLTRALRPGARLVLIVWQSADRNEWSFAVRRAITGEPAPVTSEPAPAGSGPAPAPGGQDPFSLADRDVAERVLTAAGLTGIDFTDVHEPVYYGPDTAAAYDLVLGLRAPQDLLADLDPAASERARERLHTTLAEHTTSDGVFFDSRAWIITARRR